MKIIKSVFSMVMCLIIICTGVNFVFASDSVTISSLAENVAVPAGNKIAITSSQEDGVTMQRWGDGAWEDISGWTYENNIVEIYSGDNYFRAVTPDSESNVIAVTGVNYEKTADRYSDAEAKNYTAKSTSNSGATLSFTDASAKDGIVIIEATVNVKDELGVWQIYPECSAGSYFGLFSFVTNEIIDEDPMGNIEDLSGNKHGDWIIGEDAEIKWIADYSTSKVYAYVNGVLAKVWDRSAAGLGTTHYWGKLRIDRRVIVADTVSAADIKINAYTAKSVTKSAVLSAPECEKYADCAYNMTLNVSNISGNFDVEVYNGVQKVATLAEQVAGTINVPYTPCAGANDVKVKVVNGSNVIESNTVSFVTTKKANYYTKEDYNYGSFSDLTSGKNEWGLSGTSYELVETGDSKYGKSLKYIGSSTNLRVRKDMTLSKGDTVVVENSWYFDTMPASTFYFYEFATVTASGGSGETYPMYVDKNGILHVRSKGTGVTLEAKTWYDFKAVYTIDDAGMTYTYYLNDKPLYVTLDAATGPECTHTTTATNLTQARLYVSGSPASDRAYIDNSKIYTIKDITFTKEVVGYELGDVSAKPYENNEGVKTICATINNDGDAFETVLIGAVYSGNCLKYVSVKPVSFAEGEVSKKVYCDIENVQSEDAVRAMVWNSVSGLKPFDKATDLNS